MPSIKQNAEFFQKAKNENAIAPVSSPQTDRNIEQGRIPNVPTYPQEPNARLRTPLPAALTLQPDSTRQFFNPAIPQTRIIQPTASSNISIGAAITSGGVTSVNTTPTIPLQPPPPNIGQFYEVNLNGNFEQITTVNGVPVI
jgi:hypothetical protein